MYVMKIHYYLEIRKTEIFLSAEKKVPVVLSCSYSGRRVKMHTGCRVYASHWDKDKERVMHGSSDASETNLYLEKLEELSFRAFQTLTVNNMIPEAVRLRAYLKKNKPVTQKGFFEAFTEFIEENHTNWKKFTFNKVKSLYNILIAFNEENEYSLHLVNFDEDQFKRIEIFFREEKGFADITIEKYLGVIKWFLNWAVKKKYYFNPGIRYMKPEISAKHAERRIINYLTREELMKLYNLEGLTKREERIRDVFIFLCFTGLKYNELTSLKRADIIGEELHLSSGGIKRKVPLNQYAKFILKKYEYIYFRGDSYFPCFSVMTINKYIRIIAQKSGMSRITEVSRVRKGDPVSAGLKDVIAIGYARNTFLVNALLLGISEESVRRIAGIRTSSVLRRFKEAIEVSDRNEMQKFNQLG